MQAQRHVCWKDKLIDQAEHSLNLVPDSLRPLRHTLFLTAFELADSGEVKKGLQRRHLFLDVILVEWLSLCLMDAEDTLSQRCLWITWLLLDHSLGKLCS